MFYKNYFNFKLDILNSFLRFPISISMGAIAVTILFSQSVLAQSFGGYCISQEEKQTSAQNARLNSLKGQKSPIVNITNREQPYTIVLDQINKRQLSLKESGKELPLDLMTLPEKGGKIKNIVLGEDNWLWIDRYAIDYVMKINFSQKTASFDSPIKLPELSAKPCHLLKTLLGKCQPVNYNYSASLNSIFVSGYQKKAWGKQNYVHLKVIAGEPKNVTEILDNAIFVADIPEWNGALFRKPTGEAIFYNGTTAIDLSQDFLKLENGDNFQDWAIKRTASGKTFIGKFVGRTKKDALFLMELKTKPGFTPIYLPEDFDYTWLNLYTFSDDPERTLWIVTRKVILAEVKRKLQTIVSLPLSFFITRLPINFLRANQQKDTNKISFIVKKENKKSFTHYTLREALPDADCQNILDLNQPIRLTEKSELTVRLEDLSLIKSLI